MNVETRGRAAAAGLRSATSVDVEAGLSRLRRTRRRRDVGRVIVACALVAAVAGGTFAATHREHKVPPAKPPELGNGPIIRAGERELGTPPTLPSSASYPLWQGVDPASGAFLYAWDTQNEDSVAIVDHTGTVAQVECPSRPCGLNPYPGRVAFGPGDHELTFAGPSEFGGPPQSLVVVGYDGNVREEIDLQDAALPDSAFKLMAWSPDGRHLAVGMDSEPNGEIWTISRDGSSAQLVHREDAPQQLVDGRHVNPPVVVDLAWSPDGSRLGILLAHEVQGEQGKPSDPARPLPRLIVVPAAGGKEQTLHTFEFRNPHSTVPASFIREWAFAWSPDGNRIAVTSEGGVAEISATDGTVLVQHPGVEESGPLAWLPD